jgi:ribonuclease HI
VDTTKQAVVDVQDFFPRPTQVGFSFGGITPNLKDHHTLFGTNSITAHFDGANRGNGQLRRSDKNCKAAMGVVIVDAEEGTWLAAWAAVLGKVDFTTPDGKQHVITVTGGNNRAEMIACIDLLRSLLMLKEAGAAFTTAVVVGDSAFTLAEHIDHKNAGLLQLRLVLLDIRRRLNDAGVTIQDHRVDRCYNSNADEACNAALDAREFNRQIKPLPIHQIPSLDRFDVAHLISRLTDTRVRTWRELPADIRRQYHACVALLMTDAISAGLDPIPLFLLAPTIFLRTTEKTHRRMNALKRVLLMGQTSRQSRVMLVSALLRGVDPNITHLFPDGGKVQVDREQTERSMIHGHVASRSLGKALKIADGGTLLSNDPAVREEWLKTYAPWDLPQQKRVDRLQRPDLPPTLDGASELLIEKDALFQAIRRTKSHSAPGKTGWTKDLLLGVQANDMVASVLL